MGQHELVSAVKELQELRRMQEELSAEIDALQDRIKSHMDAAGLEALTVDAWKVSYRAVTSTRFDTAAFKKAMPELAERFTKTTTSRRFTVQ